MIDSNKKMENTKIKLTIIFLALILICGCVGKTESKTAIPEVLSSNEPTKEYFETLEEVVDQYVTMSEKIIETGKKVEKTNDEPSFSDAMNMFNVVTTSTMEMLPLLEKMEKLEKEANILKEDLSPEEIQAFSETYANIMARFYEMSTN